MPEREEDQDTWTVLLDENGNPSPSLVAPADDINTNPSTIANGTQHESLVMTPTGIMARSFLPQSLDLYSQSSHLGPLLPGLSLVSSAAASHSGFTSPLVSRRNQPPVASLAPSITDPYNFSNRGFPSSTKQITPSTAGDHSSRSILLATTNPSIPSTNGGMPRPQIDYAAAARVLLGYQTTWMNVPMCEFWVRSSLYNCLPSAD